MSKELHDKVCPRRGEAFMDRLGEDAELRASLLSRALERKGITPETLLSYYQDLRGVTLN